MLISKSRIEWGDGAFRDCTFYRMTRWQLLIDIAVHWENVRSRVSGVLALPSLACLVLALGDHRID